MIGQTALWLRSCPRCTGDLYLAPTIDSDGPEFKCLQCARTYARLPETRNRMELARTNGSHGSNGRRHTWRGWSDRQLDDDRLTARAS